MSQPNLRRGMQSTSHTRSESRLKGIYGQRQPGYSLHPVLRQDRDLFLSRGLLGEGQLKDISANESSRLGERYPVDLETSRDEPPAGWPKWARPAFLKEVPDRLEDWGKRIAVAGQELERCSALSVAEARSEMPSLSEAQLSRIQLRSPPSSNLESRRRKLGETAESSLCLNDTVTADLEEDYDSATEVEELRELAALEHQVTAWEKRWRCIEQDRQRILRDNADLAHRLAASEEREKALRESLDVSETSAQELREQINSQQRKEELLHSQATNLLGQLYTLQGERDELKDGLEAAGQATQVLEDRLRASEVSDAALREKAQLENEAKEKVVAELRVAGARIYMLKQHGEALEDRLASALKAAESTAEQARCPAGPPEDSALRGEALHGEARELVQFDLRRSLPSREGQEEEDEEIDLAPPTTSSCCRCKVNLERQELRLQPLGEVGPPVLLSLEDISDINAKDAAMVIELRNSETGQRRLHVACANEQALTGLLAEISAAHRTRPGACLATLSEQPE